MAVPTSCCQVWLGGLAGEDSRGHKFGFSGRCTRAPRTRYVGHGARKVSCTTNHRARAPVLFSRSAAGSHGGRGDHGATGEWRGHMKDIPVGYLVHGEGPYREVKEQDRVPPLRAETAECAPTDL